MKFDLTKPESLLVPEELDDEILNNFNERTLRKIFTHGKLLGVSDISFQEGVPVIFKKSNMVFKMSRIPLQKTTLVKIIGALYQAREGDDTAYTRVMGAEDSNTSYTFKISLPGKPTESVRYRVNCLRDGETSVSSVCRLNNDKILNLEEIGLTPDDEIIKNMFPMKGLNLITGAVDSGKTTLIYAGLKYFIHNDPRSAFINTFENPIEADLRREARESKLGNKVALQCPVPEGVKTYSDGVKQALRRNADIILAGEVRTGSEVKGLINATLSTGKLVMATLHTDSIKMTISRLLNELHSANEGEMKATIFNLISSLNMIVSQKLLTTVSLGRVAVNEVLIFTPEIRKVLLKAELSEIPEIISDIMVTNNATMVDKAKILLEKGIISEKVYTDFYKSFSY